MADLGQSVRLAHILGILLLTAVCLFTLCVRCEQPSHSTGALTVVDSADDGDEDGYVTDDDNDQKVDEETDDVVEDFQPSEDWKDVKKGQKIPPGLHVRMDFETGRKQAKLMDDDGTKKWDAGDRIGIINTQQKTRFTRDELKKTLKDFKYQYTDPKQDKERTEEVLKKFRSYDELKSELQDIKLTAKSEGEIVSELLVRLADKECSHDETVTILTDLEYYLHQIDNAQIFSERGGISLLVTLMNSTEEQYRALAGHTLGSALQSNAKVQIAALEAGAMPQLLKMMSTDLSLAVRKKSLFAMSTLIRGFPFAQRQFLSSGGLSSLADLFRSAQDEALRIKIITLLTDLLEEYDFNVGQADSNDSIQMERTLQYKDMSLRDNMLSSGWCGLMTTLVHSSSVGHDSVDKLVTAMSALVSTCRQDFSPARPLLQGLLANYGKLAQTEREEGDDGFFTAIYSSLQQLINKLSKDEL